MNRNKYTVILVGIMLSFASSSIAQPSLPTMKAAIDKDALQQPNGVIMKLNKSNQAGIFFRNGSNLNPNDIIGWLTEKLNLRSNDDALVDDNSDVITGDGAIVAKKIRQYYKGIKVEHGVINATTANGKITMLQLEFYAIPNSFNIQPLLSERQAFEKGLEYMDAKVYAWGDGTDTSAERKLPKGELVILDDYLNDEGNVCLAYKFNMYSLQPLKRSYVYVNAANGKVVLDDPIIKHTKGNAEAVKKLGTSTGRTTQHPTSTERSLASAIDLTENINNSAGNADTRHNGRRPILADLYANPGINLKPYRLRATRNNHKIIVLDYQQKSWDVFASPSFEELAIDFTDNDNNWTAAEHRNAAMDDGATDVMDNLIWVSDYWKEVHERKSWNNSNGNMIGYVHVWESGAPMDNAFWNGTNIHFGEATGTGPIITSLDDCGHEMGHGITEKTSGLVYRWESGALNEGFSDIWAACITNFVKTRNSNFASELTWRLFEKTGHPNRVVAPGPGLRDMQNPIPFEKPSTYKAFNKFWFPADRVSCPTPERIAGGNDMCGVHNNSSVLNKWFFLITQGEVGTNSNGFSYNLTGLGFTISEKIAYLTSLNLTPNSTFGTAMTVSLNATATLYGYGSTAFNTVKKAWAAVGVDSTVYNKANTPVFDINNFTTIAVGKDGDVFAGTNYAGLYWYNGTDWTKRNELSNVRFNDIKADPFGDIWIAQSGVTGIVNGGSASAGGVNHLEYPYANPSTLYTVSTSVNIPTRNARCIFVDQFHTSEENIFRIWVATLAYIFNGNSRSGMLGEGIYTNTPKFRNVNEGIDIASNNRGCLTVGGNKHQIWTFVQANFGVNQLLVYSAANKALVATYDATSEPKIPSGFVARAIYGDNLGRIWIGLQNNGMLVYDENKRWHHINFAEIFPQDIEVSYNGITGNKQGDIYIATNQGLAYFDAGGGWAERLEDPMYYRRYGKANGLLSNSINALAYDDPRFKLWVATDSGIVAWDPPCIGEAQNCESKPGARNGFSKSVKRGNWSDTAVWESGLIPDSTTIVYITDTLVVNIDAHCRSITVTGSGALNINPGKNLKIYNEKAIIMTNQEDRRRKRQR